MVFIKHFLLEMVIDFVLLVEVHKFIHVNLFILEIAEQPTIFYFTEGWDFIGRKRDDVDPEWETFKMLTIKYIFWLICHILLTEIVRFTLPKVRPDDKTSNILI